MVQTQTLGLGHLVVSQAVVQTQTLGLGLAGLILASLFLPQRSGGAWSTGEVSQLTQAAGLVYSFMLGRPGCLESEGGCPPSSWYLLAISHPRTWRTTCSALSVYTGNNPVLFYTECGHPVFSWREKGDAYLSQLALHFKHKLSVKSFTKILTRKVYS